MGIIGDNHKRKIRAYIIVTKTMTKEDLYGKEYSRDDFVFFWKNDSLYSFLSQWYAASFVIDGIRYNCAEQYMLAQKAVMFGDSYILRKIMASDNPVIMNQFGRQVRNFNPDVWDVHCQYIVKKANIAKFSQNHFLNKSLPATGDKIVVEASPYDTIWCIGLEEDLLEACVPE